jgi:hypothetical protein
MQRTSIKLGCYIFLDLVIIAVDAAFLCSNNIHLCTRDFFGWALWTLGLSVLSLGFDSLAFY